MKSSNITNPSRVYLASAVLKPLTDALSAHVSTFLCPGSSLVS